MGIVSIIINPIDIDTINHPPNIDTLHVCVIEQVDICHEFTDPDGDATVITDLNSLFDCSLEILNDSCFSYMILPQQIGVDTVTVLVCDDQEPPACSESIVVMTIGCEPDPCEEAELSINDDDFEIEANSPETFCVLENDEGIDLEIIAIVDDPENGSASIQDDCIIYTPNEDYVGIDIFIYSVQDSCGNTTIGLVDVTINPIEEPNNPPNIDTLHVCVDDQLDICHEFTDPDGDETTIVDLTSLFDCSIEILNDSCFSYAVLPELTGVDTVTVVVCDDQEPPACSESVVVVTIGCEPDPCEETELIANDDDFEIESNTPETFCVLENDEGLDLEIGTVSEYPENGFIDIQDDCILYTPEGDYTGTDSFIYSVEDGCGNVETGTVNINIIGEDEPNNPPLIDTIEVCVDYVDPTVFCLDFIDPDGDNTFIAGSESLFDCNIVLLNDSCLRYTSLPAMTGIDTVTIYVCDDQNPPLCSESIMIVHIGCEEPVANTDNLVLNCESMTFNGETLAYTEGESVSFNVTLNDESNDVCNESTTLTEINIEEATAGTFEVIEGNQYSFTPDPNFTGTESITYTICNDCGLCDEGIITIQVNACDGPICSNVSAVCMGQLESVQICPEFCNLSDDYNPQFYGIQTLYDCSINLSEFPCVEYAALPAFVGDELMTLVACDDLGICDTAYVNITVGECSELEALDDVYTVTYETPTLLNVFENDQGENYTITDYGQGSNGSVSLSSNGLLYTPANGYLGSDNFTYTICNDNDDCETATVFIIVQEETCVNIFEMCQPSGTINLCAEFCGLTEGATIDTITSPSGTIDYTLTDGLCFEYNSYSSEVDTVLVTACLNDQDCVTSYYLISLDCGQVNAEDDTYVIVAEFTGLAINVTANDTESCGGILNVDGIMQPLNGSVSLLNSGTVVYAPNDGFTGLDEFQYVVCNECVTDCDTATVYLDIQNEMGVIANDDEIFVQKDHLSHFDVLQNDTQLEGGIQLTLWTQPTNGDLVLVNNEFIYEPDHGYIGTDLFEYTICIGEFCDDAIVNLNVLDKPIEAPIAENDSTSLLVNEDNSLIEVLNNDSDPQDLLIEITNFSQPENGTITLTNNNFYYSANEGFTGSDVFTYEICNEAGLCTTAQVFIQILDCELFIPNGFSPNGDGTNDVFEIVGLECLGINANVKIFNRWGSELYAQSQYHIENAWDGRYQNEPLPTGVYFYVLTFDPQTGIPSRSGYITLQR